MNDLFAICRDTIKINLDQPNRLLLTLSFFIHPSAFRTCLWFLAKNKHDDAQRDFRDRFLRLNSKSFYYVH